VVLRVNDRSFHGRQIRFQTNSESRTKSRCDGVPHVGIHDQRFNFVTGGHRMSAGDGPDVLELLPAQAWGQLEQDPNAVLIDVRTKAEWSFVGKPDLSSLNRSVLLIEWARYPDMSVNPRFVEEVREALDGQTPSQILLLCRSGVRSASAARALDASFGETPSSPDMINIVGGFEGDLDADKRRGGLNGWKAHGLPWRQS